MGDWQGGGQEWSSYNQETDWGGAGHTQDKEGEFDSWSNSRNHLTKRSTKSQDFQQFDYGANGGGGGYDQGQGGSSYLSQQTEYTGQMFIPDSGPAPSFGEPGAGARSGFEDEPPLLEELGINPDHIMQKTLTVLNPMRSTEASIAGDSDLAGPIVFAVAFGSFIMFSGKLYFNYIYGIGLLGCVAMYSLLNLMSVAGVSLTCVVSVLGYCLLPIVGLSGVSILFSLSGFLGNILTGAAVTWCALSSSKLFVTALEMKHQQLLVAYPCALLYGVFALITMF